MRREGYISVGLYKRHRLRLNLISFPALVPGGVLPFFSAARSVHLGGKSNIQRSQSMGRTCSTPMVRRVASLGLIADSWYSVAHDLPWSWWWEWVLVNRACNKVSVHILSYVTSTTTNDGAQ